MARGEHHERGRPRRVAGDGRSGVPTRAVWGTRIVEGAKYARGAHLRAPSPRVSFRPQMAAHGVASEASVRGRGSTPAGRGEEESLIESAPLARTPGCEPRTAWIGDGARELFVEYCAVHNQLAHLY